MYVLSSAISFSLAHDVFVFAYLLSSLSPNFLNCSLHLSPTPNFQGLQLIFFFFIYFPCLTFPYKATLQTCVFIGLFLVFIVQIFSVGNFFFLSKIFFTCPILLMISFVEFSIIGYNAA